MSNERLVSGLPRYVPVLHLRGRIGWYLRYEEVRDFLVTTTYSKQWGTPVVMWPTTKRTRPPIMRRRYQRVAAAVPGDTGPCSAGARALNDAFLLQALRENVPPDRLAITVFASAGTEPAKGRQADSEVQRIKR